MIVRRLIIRPTFIASFLLLAVGVAVLRYHLWQTLLFTGTTSSYQRNAGAKQRSLQTPKRSHSYDGKNVPRGHETVPTAASPLLENGKKHRNATSSLGKRTTETKLILFWTPKLGAEDWTWGLGSEPFQGCEYSNCEFSSDKRRVDDATMLLFYCREEPYFPAARRPHQLYAHFSREPPAQVGGDYAKYSDYINMSISYRRDGNIHMPYFEVIPYEGGSRQPYTPRISFSEKTGNVVWMTSNCRPQSKRDVYVNELKNYIDVDVYGRCGNYSCPLGKQNEIYSDCFKQFEKKYKFYLSFENAICRDYFTEKLINPLNSELVPVVFGGADYDLELPPHSFINVQEFDSPKELATFLRNMSADRYNSYFEWKSHYYVRNPHIQCKLCEFLYKSGYARGERIRPPYASNYTAWMHDSCDNSWIDKMKSKW